MPTVDVHGSRVAYRRAGAGEPVVLLHSSAGCSAQWAALGACLERDYLVLAPDLYGYGGSDAWPGARPLQLADEAAIAEALAATCAGPVHLVGHSYGGAVALMAARRARVALRSLTLIEPVAFHLLWNSDPWGEELFGQVHDFAEFVRSAVSIGDRAGAMRHFVDYWSGPGAWTRLSTAQRQRVMAAAAKIPLDFWACTSEQTPLEEYAEIEVPTLLLCGTDSPAPTRRIAGLLDIALPHARLGLVSGAGHMAPLTHAEPVNAAIAGHLRQHGLATARAA